MQRFLFDARRKITTLSVTIYKKNGRDEFVGAFGVISPFLSRVRGLMPLGHPKKIRVRIDKNKCSEFVHADKPRGFRRPVLPLQAKVIVRIFSQSRIIRLPQVVETITTARGFEIGTAV